MKQPFSYYGGKQRLIPELLKLIPPHIQYVECFTGGGSLFWAKPESHNEVLNDMNGAITNFYYQCKTNFHALQKMIEGTLHSEIHYKRSKEIVNDENADPLERAWALWCQTTMTFSFIIGGGFAFGTTGMGYGTKNKRDRFTDQYEKRLESVEIFNRDALELIKLKDTPDTFFFMDPPYVSSDQGHYDGYTEAHFINLLNALQNIKGKFLLTSYPEKALMQYREMCSVEKLGPERGWRFRDTKQIVSVDGKREGKKYKIECMTWNYQEPSLQHGLFDDSETKSQEEYDAILCTKEEVEAEISNPQTNGENETQ